jgi:hypothetical protein
MKKFISKLTKLTYQLSSPNRATLLVEGETPTSGWTEPELGNERVGDGILHLDFLGKPPDGMAGQVITPVSTKHDLLLGPQPQDVTVHSASNELSVRLPAVGDPK